MKVQNDNSVQDQSGNISKPLLQAVFLVPYVPYSLKIKPKQTSGYNQGIIDKIYTLDYIGFHQNTEKRTLNCRDFGSYFMDWEAFPILRPLADFYDINAPAFIDTNFDLTTQLVLVDLCSKKQHYSGVRYSDMQEFLREHIDVFNLIEQDLAVSIHDVV